MVVRSAQALTLLFKEVYLLLMLMGGLCFSLLLLLSQGFALCLPFLDLQTGRVQAVKLT